MAFSSINVGTNANDGTGDLIRSAFAKANSNFTELYAGGIKYLDRDFGNNFATAAASGTTVIIPNYGSAYTLTAPINLASGTSFVGAGRPILQCATGQIVTQTSATNWALRGLILDGQNASFCGTINGGTYGEIEDCQFQNTTSYLTLMGTTSNVRISKCNFSSYGVELRGVSFCTVSRNRFSSAGFGIWGDQGANKCLLEGNYTTSNTLELIALQESCYGMRIIDNHAEGCGDNGISLSGYRNTCVGNVCISNWYAGIYSWGQGNTIVGNECWNNNQNVTLQRAGIQVAAAFGGFGQNNTISGNIIGDDQASPTQTWGVKISALSYVAWGSGQVITSGTYRYNGLNLYVSTTSGTTGATPPTTTSGTQSDGGVTWQYKRTSNGALATSGNVVSDNQVVGWLVADYSDDGSWISNGLHRRQTTADMG